MEGKEAKIEVDTSYNVNLEKVEKPNSFEVGKTGNRHKIYYGEIEELVDRLVRLVELGLINEEDIDVSKLKEQVDEEAQEEKKPELS